MKHLVFVCPGARNIYHQLLMNSLLMDQEYKKIFAIQFAKVTHLIKFKIYFIYRAFYSKMENEHCI